MAVTNVGLRLSIEFEWIFIFIITTTFYLVVRSLYGISMGIIVLITLIQFICYTGNIIGRLVGVDTGNSCCCRMA